VFLAVGGVERLMLEIMLQLRDEYEFILICCEQLAEGQGSLHAAAQGLSRACFDLAELGPQESFLPMMETLKRTYGPVVVWICNGSPWQCDHAADIREVFRDIPIVDQEAYDTEQGWIARYHEPGIQSFDRFIAINRKIRDVFTGRLHMDPAKIDLIYHAINADGLPPLDLPPSQKALYARKLNVSPTEPVFAFIGRLTPQKQPLLYLELVRRLQERGDRSKFLLIGDGVLANECENFIKAHKLANISRIPHCKVAEVYPLLSGLVVTSEYEGLPLVFLDTQASGVPALSTDVGDIRQIIEEYQSGVVINDLHSAEALLAGWDELVRGLPTYRENARKAAPLVRERFSGQAVAAQYRNCFQTAIAGFRSAPGERATTGFAGASALIGR
jgi:glycosyltransferase involved in cell wall biosynthesis